LLLNLVVNARDAMTNGGRVDIVTQRIAARGAQAESVQICVRDQGEGMSPEVMARAFDPFFTTKVAGTGLGLAIVRRVTEEHGGSVAIDSKPGRGTEFRVLLPCVAQPRSLVVPAPLPAAVPGRQTVLVVDDDAQVRSGARHALERLGQRVLEADSAEGALALLRLHGAAVDVLLTDVVLQGASGKHLASEARLLRPGLPVVYMSGFPGELPAESDGEVCLEKPFSPDQLARAVRTALAFRTRVNAG
jgi:CheY-like chemotaxis protein